MSGTSLDLGYIREQIGGIVATLNAVQTSQRDRHADTREAIQSLTVELRGRQHHEAEREAVLLRRVDGMDVRLNAVESSLANVNASLLGIEARLNEMRAPVDELIGIKRRVMAYAMAAGTILMAVWVLIQPLYEDGLKQLFHWLRP